MHLSIITYTLLIFARLKVDSSIIKQLADPGNRYSFVCNAIIDACSPNTPNEKLNDMAILCAELTASCNALSAEWLGMYYICYNGFYHDYILV